MALSMYQASVPVFQRMLANLDAILTKVEAQASEQGIALEGLLEAKLAPDMFPLTRQIQIASDSAKGGAARLAGADVPSYPDTETSFAELHARIQKTLEFVSRFSAEQIDGSEEREIVLTIRGHELRFTGQDFLLHFVLPNFYFHITAAYAILRNQGLAIGKMDYLGGI